MKKIIDISKWQGNIDFTQLKNDVEFVIIRVQYGSNVEDSKHKEYEAGCIQNGIPFGVYAYGQFVSDNDAEVEAKDFLTRTPKEAQFFVLDAEEVTCSNMQSSSQKFIDYIKKNDSRKVGLYSGDSFYNAHLKEVNADFLWIARYNVNPPSVPCDLWQFADNSSVAGISAKVDENKLMGSKPLSFFTGIIETPPAPPKVEVKKALALPKPILRRGSKGSEVKLLQNLLNSLYFKCGVADGDFGPKTEDAVRRFQKVHLAYEVTGVYGYHTRAALEKALK